MNDEAITKPMNEQLAQSHLESGIRLANEGKLQDAEHLLQKVLDMEPRRVEAMVALFQIVQQRGDQTRAIDYLFRAATIEPRLLDVESHINMARALALMGRESDARECLRRALSIAPSTIAAHEMLAELELQRGEIPAAIRCYRRTITIEPARGVLNNKVHLYQSLPYKIGRIETILFDLRETLAEREIPLSLESDEIDDDLYQGRDLASTGALGRASDVLRSVCEKRTRNFDAHLTRALVLLAWHSIIGREDLIVGACGHLAQLCEHHPHAKEAWYHRGCALLRRPDHTDGGVSALECFDRAIEIDSEYEHAYAARGSLLLNAGRFQESFESFKEYTRLHDRRLQNHPLGKLGIRFLPADATQNIGHIAHIIKVMMKEELLGWRPKHSWICLAPYWFTGNRYFLDLWQEHFTVVHDPAHIRQLLPLRRLFAPREIIAHLPEGRVSIPRLAIPEIEAQWERENRGPILKLPDPDKKRGWDALEKLGIPGDAWFTTFHIRDVAFKNEGKGSAVDQLRGSDPTSYLAALKAITARGGWVIRAGEASQKLLDPFERFVQYSHSELKSEWMDLFLFSQCRFLLCGPAGVSCIPPVFHKPVALANAGVCIFQERSSDIYIPKLFRWKRDGRLLTFKELAEPPYAHREAAEACVAGGMEFIDNSPDEIADLVTEMLEQLDGTLEYTPEDEEMQARYRALYHPVYGGNLTRIGRAFLRKHRALL